MPNQILIQVNEQKTKYTKSKGNKMSESNRNARSTQVSNKGNSIDDIQRNLDIQRLNRSQRYGSKNNSIDESDNGSENSLKDVGPISPVMHPVMDINSVIKQK